MGTALPQHLTFSVLACVRTCVPSFEKQGKRTLRHWETYLLVMMLVKWLRRIIEQSLMASVYMKGAGWARQYTREGLTVHEDGLTVYKCGEGQYIREKQAVCKGNRHL